MYFKHNIVFSYNVRILLISLYNVVYISICVSDIFDTTTIASGLADNKSRVAPGAVPGKKFLLIFH